MPRVRASAGTVSGLQQSTGLIDEPVMAELAIEEPDMRIRLYLAPSGKFEIALVDQWGDPIGHLIKPHLDQKGVRKITGKLDASRRIDR